MSNTVSNKSNAILIEILLAQCQELRIFHNKINLQVRKEFCRLFLDPNFFLLVYWPKWLSEYSIFFHSICFSLRNLSKEPRNHFEN